MRRSQGFDEGRALRTSPSGRVPRWVLDEAAGRPVEPEPWRSWSPAPATRRPRRIRRILPAVVGIGLAIAAAVFAPPSLFPGVPSVAQAEFPHPTPGVGAADEPLGTPMDVPVVGESYDFVAMQPGGNGPVAYDPCRTIHYVIRPENSPVGGAELVRDAVDRVSTVTGLQFVYDGATDEQPSRDREPFQPDRYGDRWAPVLITWQTGAENPDFLTDRAGQAGSQRLSLPGDPQVYVTGGVDLDAEEFAALLASPEGTAVARAIVLHELGHLLGLDHVADASQLMFPTTSDVLDFSDGDLTGLVRLGKGACVPGM